MRQMSFIPLKSKTREDKYNSFGIIMRKKAGNETREVMYYLKHRHDFTPKGKLFYKTTKTYDFKMILYNGGNTNNENSYYAILRPRIIGNTKFLPLGDLIVPLSDLSYQGKPTSGTQTDINKVLIDVTQNNVNSMLVNGAVEYPIDYELLFENRNFLGASSNPNQEPDPDKIHYEQGAPLTIWKPLAPDGFTAFGVVFQNSYSKPNKDQIFCVSNEYISEEVYRDNFYDKIFDHENSSINIWNRNPKNDASNNLGLQHCAVVKNVRETNDSGDLKPPNPIEYPHFIVDTNPGNFNDRIYLDNVILNNAKDQNSCNFTVSLSSKRFEVEAGKRYDNLMRIDNQNSKLISFNRNSQGGKVCMGLPQPYWSSYYKETENTGAQTQDNKINSKLKGMSCGDSNDFGTNLKMYSDFSIRLADNNKYCVTHQKKNGKANLDIDDENNFLFLDKM